MPDQWTPDALLELGRGFQAPSVLLAAAELDLVSALAEHPLTVDELASALGTDLRATRILADALVALDLLEKADDRYAPAPGVARALSTGSPDSILPMLRHQANCARSWMQLAATAKAGRPSDVGPSIHGDNADYRAFIRAMDVASRGAAARLVAALGPPSFTSLLDVGAGPATWTIAFLRAAPAARATIYDLPDALPIARDNLERAGLAHRVDFVAGDFYVDEALPAGADLAWVSAIVHQSSRAENRELFAKVWAALAPGGEILVRDIVMDDSRTRPAAGALFAVNMLARTEAGSTYSFAELEADLASAAFGPATLVAGERPMDWVLRAAKSATA
jgi:precorrin-6B methylase 2